MTIRRQLLLGFFAVVAVFAAAGVVCYRELCAIKRANDVVARASELHDLAARYELAGRELQLGAFLYIHDDAPMGRQLVTGGRAAMAECRVRLAALVDGHGAAMLQEIGRLDALASQAVDGVISARAGAGQVARIEQDLHFLEARVEGLNLLLAGFADETHGQAAAALVTAGRCVERTIFITVGAIVTALLLGLAIAMWVAAKITRPVRRFIEVADKVSLGQLHHDVGVGGAREIVELGTAFQRMLNSFKVMEAMLKEDSDLRVDGVA